MSFRERERKRKRGEENMKMRGEIKR